MRRLQSRSSVLGFLSDFRYLVTTIEKNIRKHLTNGKLFDIMSHVAAASVPLAQPDRATAF